jgi:hypothetical protein
MRNFEFSLEEYLAFTPVSSLLLESICFAQPPVFEDSLGIGLPHS